MSKTNKTIGIFHLRRFNLDVAFHALNLAIPNKVEIIYDWKEVVNSSCAILIIVYPELLYAHYSRASVLEVIQTLNKPVVIISYVKRSKIPSTDLVTLLRNDTTFEQLIDKIGEVELQMKFEETSNNK